MPPTPEQNKWNMHPYLRYRLAKVEAEKSKSRIGPAMQAKINVLNSKFATRGQVAPDPMFRNYANNLTFRQQIDAAFRARQKENQELAEKTLHAFLDPAKAKSGAAMMKVELEKLSEYIIAVGPKNLKWIPGPIKTEEKALGKTVEDYGYSYGLNKDLVRGTVACETTDHVTLVVSTIRQTCIDRYGMYLIKQDEQKSILDGGMVKAGYSAWNFAVQFIEHREFPSEIQVTTADVLYGKHSKADVMKFLNLSEDLYKAMQIRLRVPGGFGHALYDISDARSKSTPQEQEWARELALDYYDQCRGTRRRCTIEQLNQRIMETASKLTTPKAKGYWAKAVKQSGWTRTQIPYDPTAIVA